jgi:hypothetical protein
MDLIEIFADETGETHFRKTDVAMDLHDFAPPSQPIRISAEMESTSSLFLIAPPGWDEEFHPTPRKQLAVMLGGAATISASDGETIEVRPGSFILLNDQDSKGHLTRVSGEENGSFLLVGVT